MSEIILPKYRERAIVREYWCGCVGSWAIFVSVYRADYVSCMVQDIIICLCRRLNALDHVVV